MTNQVDTRSSPGASHAEAQPTPRIELRDAILLIVGVVIGAGIFKTPAMVAGMAGSTGWMFGAWLLGGLVSFVGALCYAELTTAYSDAGGDYHFLRRAYGRSLAFLFGWARFSVITTGSIALLAFIFGDYMQQIAPLALPGGGLSGAAFYALAVVVILSLVNMHGIQAGIRAQGMLTALEVGGLLLIAATALFFFGDGNALAVVPAPPDAGGGAEADSFGLAMVFVLLTYGGWNEAAYISAEIRNGQRNMVRALAWSMAIIMLLYMMVTWAYWSVLGTARMAASQAVAADFMRETMGAGGEILISLLVMVCALTSINATMIVGARTRYALGRDWPLLGPLGRWNARRGTPANAMLAQCLMSLLLVGIGAAAGGGFKSMVEFTAPVFWLFFLLTGASLFVLRLREPQVARPFRVPLFPFLPLLFCAMCGYMLWSSLSYVYSQELGGWNAAWIGVAVLAAGLGLLLLMRLSPANRAALADCIPTDKEKE